jgi:hypothetical protein
MGNDQHLRGMSDSAPLYALFILLGGLGGVALLIWGLCRLLF